MGEGHQFLVTVKKTYTKQLTVPIRAIGFEAAKEWALSDETVATRLDMQMISESDMEIVAIEKIAVEDFHPHRGPSDGE